MSNKRNEARRKQAASALPPEHLVARTKNPLLNFAIPTELVDLPSKGRLYQVGHPLHGKETVEIRYMTAKEEDILSSQSLLRKGVAIDRMLNNVLIEEDLDIQQLTVGDKNAVMYAVRISGYGAEYKATIQCADCDALYAETFDLAEYVNCYTEPTTSNTRTTDNGTLEITLPKSQALVELRAITGADEEKIIKIQEMKKKNNLPEEPLTDLIKMMVHSVNGVLDRDNIHEFVDHLPAIDSKHIRDTYKNSMPNVLFTQESQCGECGVTTEVEVPITGEFFWPE